MKVTLVCFVLAFLAVQSSAFWAKKKPKPPPDTRVCKNSEWSRRGGHCYRIFTTGKNFKEAESACFLEGGHLASITSEKEEEYLVELMKKTKVKIHSRYNYKRSLTSAWVGLLLDESKKPPKMIWTDRSVNKYRPNIHGVLGRTWAKYNRWGRKKSSHFETAKLARFYRVRKPWVKPESSSKKLSYICKMEASDCRGGWQKWHRKCYKYFPKATTFTAAEEYCVKKGGHLASIHSAAEFKMLLSMIYTKGTIEAWIGVILNHGKKTWAWTDKSKPDYAPTQGAKIDGKPKGADVARLIYHNGKAVGLYDTIRSKKYGFICAKDNILPTPPTTTTTTTTPRAFI